MSVKEQLEKLLDGKVATVQKTKLITNSPVAQGYGQSGRITLIDHEEGPMVSVGFFQLKTSPIQKIIEVTDNGNETKIVFETRTSVYEATVKNGE